MTDFKRICIIGFDQLTASFGLALKKMKFQGGIVGVSDQSTISKCWKLQIITDGKENLEEGLNGADLILLSPESLAQEGLLKAVFEKAAKGAIVTDTSAIKTPISRIFAECGRNDIFYVGIHLLGKEEVCASIDESADFYFESKTMVLVPNSKDDLDAYSRLQKLMSLMGAQCTPMTVPVHDQAIAELSQLPRMAMIAVLKNIYTSQASVKLKKEILPEWMVTETVALAELNQLAWTSDIMSNSPLIAKGLDQLIQELTELKLSMMDGNLKTTIDELLSKTSEIDDTDKTLSKHLVLESGGDVKILETVAQLLAEARITIEKLDKLQHVGEGTFKLTLKSADQRDEASNLLRSAGVNVTNLT